MITDDNNREAAQQEIAYLRSAANKARAKFVSLQGLIKDNEPDLIIQAREFIKECARENEWDTSYFFLALLGNAQLPLYKLNLAGGNPETLIGQLEQAPDLKEANKDLGMFIVHLYSFCHRSQLENLSDNFYYSQHPEESVSEDMQMMGVDDDGHLTINYES